MSDISLSSRNSLANISANTYRLDVALEPLGFTQELCYLLQFLKKRYNKSNLVIFCLNFSCLESLYTLQPITLPSFCYHFACKMKK